jgi:hypothetical protein
MSLNAKIDQDLKAAMSARDEMKLSTLRFLKSALKYAAIDKKVPELPDADVMQVIQKQIKQRRESIDQFSKGGRAELAEKESRELAVLESYLPKQLSDKELEAVVASAAKEAGASSKKDFGRVMKLLQEKLAGQAEARKISEILGRILT